MSVYEDLVWRGIIHQVTADELAAKLDSEQVTLYSGYDPTGPSLHVGHLAILTAMRLLQRAGHVVIALVGGGTAPIGDPSGKSSERNLQDLATIADNKARIQAQIEKLFADDGGAAPIFRDNYDWLGKLSLIEFLRDTAKHFSVNAMIQKDSVRMRIEREGEGISFTEFSYSLLQARDFQELFERDGCSLQLGGSDQWGNIVAGIDLIRRTSGGKAYGLTCPLLTDAAGNKFGKTERGAVFLDPTLTSAYAFYQFWVNAADEEVLLLLKRFTLLPRTEIEALAATIGSPERTAQKALAADVTRSVHGEEELARAIAASQALFSGAVRDLPISTLKEIFAEVPAVELAPSRLAEGLRLTDLLAETGLCASKGDARRQLQQGAVSLNGDKLTDDRAVVADDFLHGTTLVLRRGKRNYGIARLAV